MTIVLTNHAKQRLSERYFSAALVEETVSRPDSVVAGKESDSREYRKRFDTKTVTAIVKDNKSDLVVVSCWIDPPEYGSADYRKKEKYKQYQNASFSGKIWIEIKSLFGF